MFWAVTIASIMHKVNNHIFLSFFLQKKNPCNLPTTRCIFSAAWYKRSLSPLLFQRFCPRPRMVYMNNMYWQLEIKLSLTHLDCTTRKDRKLRVYPHGYHSSSPHGIANNTLWWKQVPVVFECFMQYFSFQLHIAINEVKMQQSISSSHHSRSVPKCTNSPHTAHTIIDCSSMLS